MKRTLLCFLTCAMFSFAQAQEFPDSQEITSNIDQSEVEVTVFPNPVQNKLSIKANAAIDAYKIYNVLGALVVNGKSLQNFTELDVSDLQRGVYMLEVYLGDKQFTRKLIKE